MNAFPALPRGYSSKLIESEEEYEQLAAHDMADAALRRLQSVSRAHQRALLALAAADPELAATFVIASADYQRTLAELGRTFETRRTAGFPAVRAYRERQRAYLAKKHAEWTQRTAATREAS